MLIYLLVPLAFGLTAECDPFRARLEKVNNAYCVPDACSTGCYTYLEETAAPAFVQKLYDICQPTDFELKYVISQLTNEKTNTEQKCGKTLNITMIDTAKLKSGAYREAGTSAPTTVTVNPSSVLASQSKPMVQQSSDHLKTSALFIALVGAIMSTSL